MRWTPQSHGVLAAGDEITDMRGTLEHHRKGARPKSLRQYPRGVGNIRCPMLHIGGTGDMDDHRVIRRPPLGGKNSPDSRLIRSIGAQSVYRLGREGDQSALAKYFRCLLYFLLRYQLRPTSLTRRDTKEKQERNTKEIEK